MVVKDRVILDLYLRSNSLIWYIAATSLTSIKPYALFKSRYSARASKYLFLISRLTAFIAISLASDSAVFKLYSGGINTSELGGKEGFEYPSTNKSFFREIKLLARDILEG